MTSSLRRSRRLYTAGIMLAFLFILAAELIWLPDPIRTPGGLEWIEMINGLWYAVVLVPLLWTAGALFGLAAGRGVARRLLSGAVAAASAAAIVVVLASEERLLLAGSLMIAAGVLALADMLVSESAAPPSYTGLNRRRWPKRSLLVLLLTVLLLCLFFWPTKYRVTYPGLTMPMNRYAHVDGGSTAGRIDGVLVFERPAFPIDWVYGALLPKYEFRRIAENEPPLAEQYTQVLEMKTDANGVASAIAMEKSGIGKGISVGGVKVAAIVADGPADQLLQAGDTIETLNGTKIADVNAMTDFMTKVRPGDEVSVTLKRGGKTVKLQVPTKAASEGVSRAVFGITVQNDLHLDIPRKVDYRRYIAHIGGPSHGAMLTLAMIDQLTPGGVTNGLRVAGTGTIEADGSVGNVGGVPQKAYVVSRTNADVFFVPAEEADDARKAAPKLNVVPVRTIDDVLDWLKANKKR